MCGHALCHVLFLEEGAAGSELADGYGCAGVTILAKKDFHSTGWTPYQLAHLMVKQKVEICRDGGTEGLSLDVTQPWVQACKHAPYI